MSNRRMHTSKRLIRLASIACAAVVLSAPPAGAVIASPKSNSFGFFVFVGNQVRVQSAEICGYSFNYVQRMTIDGVSTLVPTETVYSPGRHALVLLDTCDGYNIFGVGSSAS